MDEKIIRRFKDGDGNIGYHFHCDGCNSAHGVYVIQGTLTFKKGKLVKGKEVPIWGFNGDEEKPTFSPSVLARWNEGEGKTPKVCHSFVRDGEIEYLTDCTHHLAGKKVKLTKF